MPKINKIGVLTGGGDAPGLNAVIRAVVKSACNAGVEVIGLEDSFDGLIYPEKSRPLVPRDVTGILRLGGTMLGVAAIVSAAVVARIVHARRSRSSAAADHAP